MVKYVYKAMNAEYDAKKFCRLGDTRFILVILINIVKNLKNPKRKYKKSLFKLEIERNFDIINYKKPMDTNLSSYTNMKICKIRIKFM